MTPFPFNMKNLVVFLFFLFFLAFLPAFSQNRKAEQLGFKHIPLIFQNDTIHILLLSKKGEEKLPKPLFFFCQGSLPVPLIITDGAAHYPSFPFETKALCESYHLAIVGKPGVPLFAEVNDLQPDFSYLLQSSKRPPPKYEEFNYLDYYLNRNMKVIDYFFEQEYIDKSSLVVAGHSQGARIALEMAVKSKRVSHLIYASGNPCGQFMSMISRSRSRENPFDSISHTENDFRFYEAVVADSSNMDNSSGDSFKSIFSFSKSSLHDFEKLNIPVWVGYGTLDPNTPFNDLLRAESIRLRKKTFTFKAYKGLDHNFFGIKETGETDFENFNWDKVANDWLTWLSATKQ